MPSARALMILLALALPACQEPTPGTTDSEDGSGTGDSTTGPGPTTTSTITDPDTTSADETSTGSDTTTGDESTGTTGEPACSLVGPRDHVRSDCNPLDPSLCALPYPSSYYLEPDPTPTGVRVSFGDGSLPVSDTGTPTVPTYFNEKDGFSTMGAMLTYFEDVSIDGVVGHQDLDAYLADDVKTVILDVETGDRIPHFVELDMTAPDATERLLMIQPVVPLRHAARYVVGIRGLTRSDGSPVDVSSGFASLRDCVEDPDPDVESLRDDYEQVVFPTLEDAGFAREEMQLAWDFMTVSRDNSLGRLEVMREDALMRMGPGGPSYVVTDVQDHDCMSGPIGRTVTVDMTVPLYTEADGPGTVLTRGPDGLPYYNGDTTVEAIVRIPCSLIAAPAPSMVVQYGHGLLGSHDEARTSYLSQMANDYGWVVLASSWTGMKDQDIPAVVGVFMGNVSGFPIVPERSQQGFVEAMAALRMVQGDLASDPAVTFGGISVIDPNDFGYYGNSQGTLLGGAYLAASPDLTHGVLGVGGTPYRLILTRSVDFDPFFDMLRGQFDDHRDIILTLETFQHLWDPGETAGWLHDINDPPPGIPAKTVLMQVGIGDAQVTTLSAHVMARAFEATTVAPQTRPIWGVPEQAPGFSGTAIVEWNYTDVPPEPVTNTPPNGATDTHECPRREAQAQDQLRDFLEQGVVNQYCVGICEGVQAVTCP